MLAIITALEVNAANQMKVCPEDRFQVDSLHFRQVRCTNLKISDSAWPALYGIIKDDTLDLELAWQGKVGCNKFQMSYRQIADTLLLYVNDLDGSCEGILGPVCLRFLFLLNTPPHLINVLAIDRSSGQILAESRLEIEGCSNQKNKSKRKENRE